MGSAKGKGQADRDNDDIGDACDEFPQDILVGDSRGARRLLQAAHLLAPKRLLVACEGWDRVNPAILRDSGHDQIIVTHSFTDQVFGQKEGWAEFIEKFPNYHSAKYLVQQGEPPKESQLSDRAVWQYDWLPATHGLGSIDNWPVFRAVCDRIKASLLITDP